jgi:hypothetical protein
MLRRLADACPEFVYRGEISLSYGLNNPRFDTDSYSLEDGVTMAQVKRYSPEVRDRAIPMVVDHRGE